MREDVVVRNARLEDPADADAVVCLLDAYAGERIGGGQPLPYYVKARLVTGLRDHPGVRVALLASVAGETVGMAVCFLGFSTFAARPLLNLHDLFVLPNFRGCGIGHTLLRAVEDHARHLGCCKVTLEVRRDNARARRLYRRRGFREFAAAGASTRIYFMDKPL